MASIERTAYPRCTRTVSSRELQDAFTPSGDEIAWAVERTSTGQHRLALLVLLLKCYQRLGYFPTLTTVPGDVVGYVRPQLGLDASVAAEHDAPRTTTCWSGSSSGSGVEEEPSRSERLARPLRLR
ncbi:DUF4158 domain-containing protein [Frankia tisae]|uniref:DUF4158 domain-containing protein n=1 Tax=Frankia tisae TaxID=2950104 RepID=UPI0021BF2295|nr:DUF4158 domain-containing protein [Frankia tisae]